MFTFLTRRMLSAAPGQRYAQLPSQNHIRVEYSAAARQSALRTHHGESQAYAEKVERQTANETSEQTEERDHVGRDHFGRDHVATTHRLTRSSSEAIRQPTSPATNRHL